MLNVFSLQQSTFSVGRCLDAQTRKDLRCRVFKQVTPQTLGHVGGRVSAGGGAQRVPMFTAHAMKVCAEVLRCDTATWGTHPDILQCVGVSSGRPDIEGG